MAWSDRSEREVARGFVSCAASAEQLGSIDGATVTVYIQVSASMSHSRGEHRRAAKNSFRIRVPLAVGQLPLSRVEVLASPSAIGPSVR